MNKEQLGQGANLLYDAYLKNTGGQGFGPAGNSLMDIILKRNLNIGLGDRTNLGFQFPKGWDEEELRNNPYGIHLTYDF
tara:strand:- start:14865 stop:15101 length:237 start_codon:yes stop_codon:yes gene_type:complete